MDGDKQYLAQPQNIYVPRKSSYQGLGFLNLTSQAPTTDAGKANDGACQIFASQLENFAGESNLLIRCVHYAQSRLSDYQSRCRGSMSIYNSPMIPARLRNDTNSTTGRGSFFTDLSRRFASDH
jgi:hypothetical protein